MIYFWFYLNIWSMDKTNDVQFFCNFCHKVQIDQRPMMFWISHYTSWYRTVRISRWVVLNLLKIRFMLVICLNRFTFVASGENRHGGMNNKKSDIKIHLIFQRFLKKKKKKKVLAFQFALISHTSSYRVQGLVPCQAVWKPFFEKHSLCAEWMLHHIDIS